MNGTSLIRRWARLASSSIATGDGPASPSNPRRGPIRGGVVAVGPLALWKDVFPEGGLIFDPSAAVITVPVNGAITGPTPLLICSPPRGHARAAVDIVIEARTGERNIYFRVSLRNSSVADLAALQISLPPGEAHLWTAQKSADGRWITSGRVDIHVALRAPTSGRRIAVVGPPYSAPAGGANGDAQPVEPLVDDGQLHLAAWARDMTSASGTACDPKFMFGPLGEKVDLLLATAGVHGILPNAFTAAWLGTLLAENETKSILIEQSTDAVFGGQAMAEAMSRFLPQAVIHREGPSGIRLDRTEALQECVRSLPTAYPILHGSYAGFRARFAERGWADIAARSFMYSMLGTSRNSLLLEQLAARLGWGGTPTIVDIGAGFGLLGLELASKGWNATVIDCDAFRVEEIGSWLAGQSSKTLQLERIVRSMDDIPKGGVPGKLAPQAIAFFHSLLLAQREHVSDILRACWARLTPGGALILHELVRGTPGESSEDSRLFEFDELLRLVAENATAPRFISVLDGKPMQQFVPGNSLIVALR